MDFPNCTPKQLRIIKFIKNYQDVHGFSPTYAEIAAEFEVTAVTIYGHICALEQKGFVKHNKHMSRSVEIVARKHKSDVVNGVFCSGRPISWFSEQVKCDALHSDFVLRVNDDSLKGRDIFKNDLLVFSACSETADNSVVLLSDGVNGDAVITEYSIVHPGVPFENAKVCGVLVRLVRNF
jgi:repressor LexA